MAKESARRFHFISGLPRAGSTLTAAILRQNPRFHAGMSSPIASLCDLIIAQVSAGSELSTMVNEAQRARILRGLFDSYYADFTQPVIFDTNRAWTAQLSTLMRLFPDAKIICCVRDVAWVMDSLERQFRNNAFENTRLFNNPAERATVYTRVETLAHANRLVGFAWHALREACYSEFAERVLLLEYDLLVTRPGEVFKLVYEFLGEPLFKHDFAKVEYDAPVFDAQLGLDGLHRVGQHVLKEIVQAFCRPTSSSATRSLRSGAISRIPRHFALSCRAAPRSSRRQCLNRSGQLRQASRRKANNSLRHDRPGRD